MADETTGENELNEENMTPLEYFRTADPDVIVKVLKEESVHTIAVVLSCMENDKAAFLLQNLDKDLILAVSIELSKEEKLTKDTVDSILSDIKNKVIEYSKREYIHIGGVSKLIDILSMMNKSCENMIIDTFKTADSKVYSQLREQVFQFDDILMLDDRAIQKVLREVDSMELAKALKGTDSEIQDKVFRNMSKRAGDMLREEMEFMGPVRLRDVEESQIKIISVIQRLEDSGEIIICRAFNDGEILV